LLIGRADADLVLDDDGEVSRRHAIVRQVGGKFLIEDLGSLNGTFVNGTQITAATALEEGATVRIGATDLVVVGGGGGGSTKITGPLDPNATRVAVVAEPGPAGGEVEEGAAEPG